MRGEAGTGDLGPRGYFPFTIHTSKVTGDHLSGLYSVNLDPHWVMGTWMDIQAPSPLRETEDRDPWWWTLNLASSIGTGTAEDAGRRHVCGAVHG